MVWTHGEMLETLRRADEKRVWYALPSPNEGLNHLQGDRQPSCRPVQMGPFGQDTGLSNRKTKVTQ